MTFYNPKLENTRSIGHLSADRIRELEVVEKVQNFPDLNKTD